MLTAHRKPPKEQEAPPRSASGSKAEVFLRLEVFASQGDFGFGSIRTLLDAIGHLTTLTKIRRSSTIKGLQLVSSGSFTFGNRANPAEPMPPLQLIAHTSQTGRLP
jgi:hypothetical protein